MLLTACGGGGARQASPAATAVPTSASAQAPDPTSDDSAPVVEPTDAPPAATQPGEPAQEPTDAPPSVVPTAAPPIEEPTDEPTVEPPTEEPTAAPPAPPTNAPTQAPAPTTPPEANPTDVPAPSVIPTAPPTSTPAATAEPTPTSAPDEPATPMRLKIDTGAVQVDAAIEYVGKVASGPNEGAMDVPKAWENVAWYEPGYLPGEPGNSVLAGHLDSTTGPAVFYKLDQIKVGDILTVVDKDNRSIQFRVTKSQVYYNDEAPLYEIFGPSDESHLNLITCDGAFDRNSKEYDRKLVVFSVLVS